MALSDPVASTIYFVGVTTAESAITRILPAWAAELGVPAELSGIDLPLDASREQYRAVVRRIRDDPAARGALVTTHKLGLAAAASDLFSEFDDDARALAEVGLIVKRDDRLVALGSDSQTVALALSDIVDDGYWERTGGDLVIFGAGGAARALILHLARRARDGGDVPSRITLTDEHPGALEAVRTAQDDGSASLMIDYVLAESAEENRRVVSHAAASSLIVNATGRGKDRPGSPIPDGTTFPADSIAWDFNYRGRLVFLAQARAAGVATVLDGWSYFLHGWMYAFSKVFDVEIAHTGPRYRRLVQIAQECVDARDLDHDETHARA